MLRRDFLAGAATLILTSFAAAPEALCRDDTEVESRGRGRGGDDTGFDDHGGGSSSGHGSSEERAASLGDGRGDRAESRLREELRLDRSHDAERLDRSGRGASGGQVRGQIAGDRITPNAEPGLARVIADLMSFFQGR